MNIEAQRVLKKTHVATKLQQPGGIQERTLDSMTGNDSPGTNIIFSYPTGNFTQHILAQERKRVQAIIIFLPS